MANRPSSLLPDIDIPDPMDTAAEYQQNIDKGLASNNFTSKGAAFGNLLGRAMNGGMDPATQKAAAEQGAVKETLSNLQPQQDNEDDLTYQLRQAHAVYNTVAPMDTNLAMKAMDRIATLSEAKTQQARLQSETAKETQESDIRAVTQGTMVLTDGQGNNLGLVHRFQDDGRTPNPQFGDQLRKGLSDNPGSFPVTSEKFENDRANLAMVKGSQQAQLEVLKAQAKAAAGSVDDDTMKSWIEAYAAHGPMAWNRLPPDERNALRKYATAHSLHESDLVAAQTQIAAIRSEGVAAGRRTGNIDVLSRTLQPLGEALVTAASNVDRSRLSVVNGLIHAGKTQFQDPAERRYALALNAFNTEYARAMSGGVGQTSDSSRADTKELLPINSNLDVIRAGVDQVVNKEQKALQKAGDQALEVTANPQKYSALVRVQKKLWGEEKAGGLIDFETISNAPAAPAARPGQTTGASLGAQVDAIIGGR